MEEWFEKVLGSDTQVPVVIYCLGIWFESKDSTGSWIGNLKIYDPVMSELDKSACYELDLTVLEYNEDCKRKAQRPTMFFITKKIKYFF